MVASIAWRGLPGARFAGFDLDLDVWRELALVTGDVLEVRPLNRAGERVGIAFSATVIDGDELRLSRAVPPSADYVRFVVGERANGA